MSSKSIFQQTHAPRTSRLVPMFDGATTSVHSNLAIGRVCGDHREIMAVVSPTATDDDVWRVVNLKSKGSDTDQFDSIAVLGAIDDDQAVEWAFNQRGRFLLDSIVLSVGETNTPGLKRYLDSERLNYRANSQIHLNQLSKLQDMTTGQPVMWDGVNLKSHSNSSAVLLVDLVKHDDNSQLFDAIKADDMPALLELLGAEAMGYDALIVESRKLDTLMQRLGTAMSKATQSGVTVTNVRQSEPFKRNKVTQVAAIFEMSDGQSVSIVFHNPDSTPSKLLPQDTLISWKFLLNSRDISAAVQPNQGEDVQLPVLATRVMKLVNQNSARFARTNAKKAENVAALDEAKARIETKSQTVAALDAEIAQLQAELDKPTPVEPEAKPQSKTPTTGKGLTDAQKVVLIATAGFKPAFRFQQAQRHTRGGISGTGGITEYQYNQAVQELNENGRYLKRSAITDAGRKIVAEMEGHYSTDKLEFFTPAFASADVVEPEPFSQYRPNFDKIAKVLTENFGWSYETSDTSKITKDFVMGLDGKKQSVIAYQYEYDLLATRSTDDKQLAAINLAQDQYLDTLAKVRSAAGEFDARIQEVEDNWLAEAKTAQDAANEVLTTQQRTEQAFEGVKAVLAKDYGWSPRGGAPLKKAFDGAQASGSLNPDGTVYVSAYLEGINLVATVGNGMDDPKRIAFGNLPQYNLNQDSFDRVARLFNRDVENYIDARRRELQQKPAVEPTTTTTDLGNNESVSRGMAENRDGTFTALTLVDSKTFKTRAGAERWLAQRGLNPDGTRMAKPEPTESIDTLASQKDLRASAKALEEKIASAKSRETALNLAAAAVQKAPEMQRYALSALQSYVVAQNRENYILDFPKPPPKKYRSDQDISKDVARLNKALANTPYGISGRGNNSSISFKINDQNLRKYIDFSIMRDESNETSDYKVVGVRPYWLADAIAKWFGGDEVKSLVSDAKESKWVRFNIEGTLLGAVRELTGDDSSTSNPDPAPTPAVEPEPTPEVKPDPTAAMRAGKMQAHLNQSIQTTDGKVTTIGKLIDLRISQGSRPVEKSKRDSAAEKRLMTEFEALARNAPIGNSNHPDTIRLNELKAMKKDPSKFKYGEFVVTVPSYFLEGKDGEPSMVLTKTGFEYAQSVVANMPDPAPTPEEPTVTATNPDAEFFQSIISGTVDPLTVDMDYVIELAEKHENDPEMGALLEDALEAINKAEQAASQGI